MIKALIEELQSESNLIPEARKTQLKELATLIGEKSNGIRYLWINFICTHNSRRSQISEIWFRTVCKYLGITNLGSCSSGTETTALNERAVEALYRSGFAVQKFRSGVNPRYKISDHFNSNPQLMFSKTFDALPDDRKPFLAIMVCSDADENCPFVPGAVGRFSLNYVDPKIGDYTEKEKEIYDLKVREIGREILYLGNCLSSDL